MHEIAATLASASVILIGIIFGVLYNQRGIDQLDACIDRLETRLDARNNGLESRLEKIQDDLNGFHRSLGQHDKAIEVLEKRST